MQNQKRRFDLFGISQGRHATVPVGVFPGMSSEFHPVEKTDIRGAGETFQVDYRALGYRGAKTVGMTYYPVGHITAVGATGHAQSLLIDIWQSLQIVGGCHTIDIIETSPVPDNGTGPEFASSGAPAGISVKDYIPPRCQIEHLMKEGKTVLHPRSAMNLQYAGIFSIATHLGRGYQPPLQVGAVVPFEPDFFNSRNIDAVQQLFIQFRQPHRFAVPLISGRDDINIPRGAQVEPVDGKIPHLAVETVRPNMTGLPGYSSRKAAFRGDIEEMSAAGVGCGEIYPLAVRRPVQRGPIMSLAQVVNRLVQTLTVKFRCDIFCRRLSLQTDRPDMLIVHSPSVIGILVSQIGNPLSIRGECGKSYRTGRCRYSFFPAARN